MQNLKKGYRWTYLQNRNWLTDFEKLMGTKEDRCGGGHGGRMDWGSGIGIGTLRSMEWLASGDLLYSTENSTQYPVIICGRRIWESMDTCMYGCVALLYSRNYHNLVNQLYLKKKWKCKGEDCLQSLISLGVYLMESDLGCPLAQLLSSTMNPKSPMASDTDPKGRLRKEAAWLNTGKARILSLDPVVLALSASFLTAV